MPRSALSLRPAPIRFTTAALLACGVGLGVLATGACGSTGSTLEGGSGGATASTSGGASGGATPTTGGTATGGASPTAGEANTYCGSAAASGGASSTAGGQSSASGGVTSGAGGATVAGGQANAGAAAGGAASGGVSGTSLWIAPDGLDSNPGSEAAPFKTLTTAQTHASAGSTIWVKPGTYAWSATVQLTKSGTDANPINVFAAAGARPVFDFSAQTRGSSSARGLELKGDYWHLKGIDVINAGDNCIHVTGSHNTLEWLVTHGCDDTGLQITVDSSLASDATRGAYNTVLNCDSYENYDSTTGGENADGFAAKLYIGPGNVFRGCRSWNNSDDGWDLFASNDVVSIDNCWAFLNGKTSAGQSNPAGDGNGFKLGGAPTAGDANQGGAVHLVTNSFAFENLACGFVRNNNPSVPKLSMCGGHDDPKGEYCSLTNSSAVSFSMTGAQAKAVQRNADGSLPAIH